MRLRSRLARLSVSRGNFLTEPVIARRFDVVIVGAGQAGGQLAIALRQMKFEGSVAVIGAEREPPYERPALSKEYLAGDKDWPRLLLRQDAFWEERKIELLLGERVMQVAPDKRHVGLESGERIGYGTLVWAAGGAPRNLACSGHDLPGVHAIRTRADVDRLRSELDGVERIVVVGGGYVGLEAAATLRKAGKHIMIVEALDRLLARVAGASVSRFYEAEHRAHGVEFRFGSSVSCITESRGRVSGVTLTDGEIIPADIVIVGIGIVPEVAPLLAAGADGSNGVAVDEQCRTSLAEIYAIGDCALHASRFACGASIRLESVQNANDMAMVAAKSICGVSTSYDAVPWFWSNQYDLRLQTAGLSVGHDATLVRGSPSARSFSVLYLKSGRLICVDAINSTADFVQAKALIAQSAEIMAEVAMDPAVSLKDPRIVADLSVQSVLTLSDLQDDKKEDKLCIGSQ